MLERGMLTEQIQVLAKDFLKREITVRELRLYPYIDFELKNSNQITNINKEEREIINQLILEGHCQWNNGKLFITGDFYDYMQKVLKIAYAGQWLISDEDIQTGTNK